MQSDCILCRCYNWKYSFIHEARLVKHTARVMHRAVIGAEFTVVCCHTILIASANRCDYHLLEYFPHFVHDTSRFIEKWVGYHSSCLFTNADLSFMVPD